MPKRCTHIVAGNALVAELCRPPLVVAFAMFGQIGLEIHVNTASVLVPSVAALRSLAL